MGIQGLLPFLANSTRDAHISEFENECVAVDAYCWLHKGIYSCAVELAMGKPTTKYVTYCMRYIEMLLHFKVKPILIFDGRHLSSKNETEKKRREERKKKYEKGKELIRAGKTYEGRKLLGESVDVTHGLALNLIKECHKKNIDCIVAPYEADSQLAFLSLRNIVKCIITEDSDLLAYGCEKVMFKMDTSGRGRLIEKSNIHFSLNMTPEEFNEDIFRYMCILSGCDYLPSLPSIGPANALKFVKMLKGNDIYDALPRLPLYINKLNVKVTPEYIIGFKIADNTFKHQLVYDPFIRSQVPLKPTKNDDEIVGIKLPDDQAFQLAVGNVDPITMKTLYNFDPDKFNRGFNILRKKDLSEFSPGLVLFNSEKTTEAKKRQRENLESDTVQSITNDFKKQRLPGNITNIKNSSAKRTVSEVPKSAFVFDPKVSDEKKKVLFNKKLYDDESKLLKSRYFSREESKGREKKEIFDSSDRQKDESYEDYLQRLYNECFPICENGDEGPKEECYEKQERNITFKRFCPSCKKNLCCCSCPDDNVMLSDSQLLGTSITEIEESKKAEEESVQHFLLNEIYNNQHNESLDKNFLSENYEKETNKNINDVSPSESFCLKFTKMLSKLDGKDSFTPKNSKTKSPEKENSEQIFEEKLESGRSPSPVFRVQKDSRILNWNCRLGNVSDTASTPTSVYFSSFDSRSSKSEPVFLENISSTPLRKIPLKGFSRDPSKAMKNNIKNSSVNRTLFQFGFKKESANQSPKSFNQSRFKYLKSKKKRTGHFSKGK